MSSRENTVVRRGTIFRSYELFVAAAVIAAHAAAPHEGFRQRDVRFLIELFSNWVELSLPGPVLEINNTQVQRYLEDLVAEGLARRLSRGRLPRYRLARTGLIELLSRIIPHSLYPQPQQFFFLYYFICNYCPRIEKLIREEGKQFPTAMKLEVQALLDSDTLIKQQIQATEIELRKIDERIHDAEKASELFRDLEKRGMPLLRAAKEIQKLYPYELNSQKPLTELISSLPEDLAAWELSHGTLCRMNHIWQPTREILKAYLSALRRLA